MICHFNVSNSVQLHVCQNKTPWNDSFCYTSVLVENPAVSQGIPGNFVEIAKLFVFNQFLVLMTDLFDVSHLTCCY